MLGECERRICVGRCGLGYGMKPVLFAFACLLSCAGLEARAEAVSPDKAAEMLAHAWMVDNRCNVLGNDDRDLLTNFVARAEISLAEKKSVAAARAAIGRGRASGTAAPCDSMSAKSVQDVLRAARTASAPAEMELPSAAVPEAPVAAPEPEPAPQQDAVLDGEAPEPVPALNAPTQANRIDEVEPAPVVAPLRKRAVVQTPRTVQKPARVVIKRVPAPKRVAAKKPVEKKIAMVQTRPAGGYAVTAEAYYKELRCRRKSLQAVRAMYAQVLRQHRAAVSASGKSAVRTLLRQAEARASRGSC